MKINFVIPPLVELHSPYPSTAYLSGYFKTLNHPALKFSQADLGIQFFHKVFSEKGFSQIQNYLSEKYLTRKATPESVRIFLENFEEYASKISPVMDFLTGHDTSLASRLADRQFLPNKINGEKIWFYEQHILSGQIEKKFGSKVSNASLDPLTFSFGDLGIHDRARYLSTLFLKEVTEVIIDGIDEEFALSDFGDKLCDGAYLFEPIRKKLEGSPTVLDDILDDLAGEWFQNNPAEVVALTIPHPGTMYGALRIARKIKSMSPETFILAGGGYINGQLRGLQDSRIFDYFDFLTLDRGYKPLEQILRFILGEASDSELHNTLVLEDDRVQKKMDPNFREVHHRDTRAPDYTGLDKKAYLAPLDILTPVESLWNSIKWNRMNLTYGCYWAKCTFCPVNLDYIGNYESAEVDFLINHIKEVIATTGSRGFYFVDKAMPPKLLRNLCQRILDEKIQITWWGYIRFDRGFNSELANLMAKAGCIAVLCGLESGSDRALKFMDKGTTTREITQVAHNLSHSGIMVHGYLIYGYPQESFEEILNTLEFVRQLFKEKCLHSVSWSKLFLTQHSLLAERPEAYGIRLTPQPKAKQFATFTREWEYADGRDRLWFTDKICLNGLGRGLLNAGLRYNHGVGLDNDIRTWFYGLELPRPSLSSTFVKDIISQKSQQRLDFISAKTPSHSLKRAASALVADTKQS